MLPNNRLKWTAFTKERADVSLFFFFCFFFLARGGGTFFPGAGLLKQYFHTYVHCTVVHLSPFEVPEFQVFLSRLPKLTPWKSRLPKFKS